MLAADERRCVRRKTGYRDGHDLETLPIVANCLIATIDHWYVNGQTTETRYWFKKKKNIGTCYYLKRCLKFTNYYLFKKYVD